MTGHGASTAAGQVGQGGKNVGLVTSLRENQCVLGATGLVPSCRGSFCTLWMGSAFWVPSGLDGQSFWKLPVLPGSDASSEPQYYDFCNYWH